MTDPAKPTDTPGASPSMQGARPRKVLVVGATGFLGAQILRHLEQEASVTLRAMSRRGAPAQATASVEWVRGDLMDPASLDAALRGVDVVVSSANGYMKESIQTDFQGNRNLVEAAKRAGVGTQVVARDVNGDRRPDLIVGNKRGVFVFTQK